MQKEHNFRIAMIVLVVMICTLLAACKSQFTCDLCCQKSSGEKYDMTNWGRGYVCEDCYDYLWGRG